ncbi:DUF2066 domain-containing protein [Catenovulum adriaticum]|uniref:DUF2066 domain-containing protein n=1 Tax=Catenovulum adriaticum TaxID=2984846 RepID=A0ABY7AJ84_9ALTE|nr:DUF2066 domain-containing protein [Catenovulum sp. TS8]WAJ69293.1 DUF2066 domain-containing protein [Catenovulum sp. TS8]
MNGLYTAQIAVQTQTYQERQNAYKKAIEVVFIRISGNPHISNHSDIKSAITNSTRYLSQYQFQHIDGQLFLKAQFNEKAINQQIRATGGTIWGSRRPQLIWWLALENDDGQRNIVADGNNDITRSVFEQSRVRGVASLFPLVDFDDLMLVSLSDIWGRFDEPALRASERYQAEVIVLGKIFKQKAQDSVSSQAWFAQLNLVDGSHSQPLLVNADDKNLLMSKVVDEVANLLAQKYSIKASDVTTEDLSLTVENIDNAAEAIVIQDFLATISAVDTVKIYQLNQSGVTYHLNLLGEALDVYDALTFDDRIEKVTPKFGQENSMPNSLYRWKGQSH